MSDRGILLPRPNSELLVDLHVYIVPPELWREQLQNAINNIVDDSVSAGFIRVLPETNIYSLRDEVEGQLGAEALPRDYVFLKVVGRHLTRIRPKQEFQLKVKNFLPPQSYAPEIYLLEASAEVRATFSTASSQRSEDPYRLESYRSPYGDKPEFNSRRPLPGINGNGYDSPKSSIATQTGEDVRRPVTSKMSQTSRPNTPQTKTNDPRQQQKQSDNKPPKRPLSTSDADSGDAPLPPLSASPPNSAASPQPTTARRPATTNNNDDNDEFRPPLSATPPQTPQNNNRNKPPPAKSQTLRTSSPPPHNPPPATDDLDRLRLEEMMMRRQLEEEERRRREAEEAARRLREQQEEEERRRRSWESEDAERRRREEERRRWELEEEERRRRKEQEEEEERRRRRLAEEEEERRRREMEERFPTPPPPPRTPPMDRDQEKEELLRQLDRLRMERKQIERRREELVRKAKQLQAKTQSRRNAARDVWKKKYFDEKKKTAPIEEQTNKLKSELDQLHRKIMSTLEGAKDKDGRRIGPEPSEMANLKIQSTRHQHDIEDLQRRVENIKMKLTSEMKLRNQAETELRALRAELTQKKINVTLARTAQQQSALGPSGGHFLTSNQYTPALVTPRS